jgi:hypothetical protein
MHRVRISLFLFVAFIHSISAYGQLTGKVVDERGEPLPYASIYIENSSTGTSSNPNGYFELALAPGHYDVVFQYLGYATQVHTFIIGVDESIDGVIITMLPESLELDEVVVSANAEDPAYAIIRKAIGLRDYYKHNINSFSCDVYVKGNQKLLDAPEKIMGFEVGDLDGMLDSNRQGIVYLSESISRLYFQAPDDYKEVVISSKVSGDDRGYSFNSAKEMEISFYENTIFVNRNLISPIADNALSYYRYRLLGAYVDSRGRMVNKIQIIPKRESDPVFYGTIYITEDLWNIYGLELGATAKATQLYFIDSLNLKQVYIPVGEEDEWRLFTNTITFEISAFGFDFEGIFTAVYSNYELIPLLEPGFFDHQVYVVEPLSNQKDSQFWERVRPVPLTLEEIKDYHRKDSLELVRNDPIYMDSVDRATNRFRVGDLIGGYSFQKTRDHFYASLSSPLGQAGFNTVQGFYLNTRIDVRKYFDEEETRRILLYSDLNYGFSERQFRMKGSLIYRPDRLTGRQFRISGGSGVYQFNEDQPITPLGNTLYSLLVERNYAKFYSKRFLSASHTTELWNGLSLRYMVSWEDRFPMINVSDFSLFDIKDRSYFSNDPLNPGSFSASFNRHQALLLDLSLTVRFKQRYVVYPYRRFSAGHKGPILRLQYRKAFPIGSSDISFHRFYLTASDKFRTGIAGQFGIFARSGIFSHSGDIKFMDYAHFKGLELIAYLARGNSDRFLLLPYYAYSTRDKFIELHLEHDFEGFLLDKIPGINQLGLGIVIGSSYLKSSPHSAYWEWHVGLDKIGYKLARILRFDVAISNFEGNTELGWRLGVVLGNNFE